MEVCAIDHTSQLLVVEGPDYGSAKARLTLLEKESRRGLWNVVGTMPAAIGRHGMSADKREGDGKTPIGRFEMGIGFGTLPAPARCRWPYKRVGPHDYWVDDPESPDYNQWVHFEGDPALRWKSFERLEIPLYARAAVIRYNEAPIVSGKGSAIFFHIWGGSDSYSAGCVTVAEENVSRVLEWMAPESKPVMAVGTRKELEYLVPFYKPQY